MPLLLTSAQHLLNCLNRQIVLILPNELCASVAMTECLLFAPSVDFLILNYSGIIAINLTGSQDMMFLSTLLGVICFYFVEISLDSGVHYDIHSCVYFHMFLRVCVYYGFRSDCH